jgi:hypothetical protein
MLAPLDEGLNDVPPWLRVALARGRSCAQLRLYCGRVIKPLPVPATPHPDCHAAVQSDRVGHCLVTKADRDASLSPRMAAAPVTRPTG